MNTNPSLNKHLEHLAAAWNLAAGRPLPFLPVPRAVPPDFPLYIPIAGFLFGGVAALLSWILRVVFGALAGSLLSGIAAALLFELASGWRGFNGAGLLAGKAFRGVSSSNPGFMSQPVFFGALFFAVRAIMIAAIVQTGASFWLAAVFLCGFFGREEVSGVLTPDGMEMIPASGTARRRGFLSGLILTLIDIVVFRRLWGVILFFFFAWLMGWYFTKRSQGGAGVLRFDRMTFDTYGYLQETAFLILTVIFLVH